MPLWDSHSTSGAGGQHHPIGPVLAADTAESFPKVMVMGEGRRVGRIPEPDKERLAGTWKGGKETGMRGSTKVSRKEKMK